MNENTPTFEDPNMDYPTLNQRPQFLKVLCILSWVNAGFQLFFLTLYKLMVNEDMKEMIYSMSPDDTTKEIYQRTFNILDETSIYLLILYLASIGVVYMMWTMKKAGYYGYLGAHILILFVPFIEQQFTITDLLSSSIFSVLFMVMYGLNAKHLNA